jgi:preprotein translocase subunit SecA
MDYMREGIHLRGMAQKDPLVEYRNEGHLMFQELNRAIREEVIALLFHAEVEPADASALEQQQNGQGNGNLMYEHQTAAGADVIAAAGAGEAVATALPQPQQRVMAENKKLGRNDPCWCGSGRKYKKCHGA